MDANRQLTINSFRQLFPDKIFSLTLPWFVVKSLTFHWQLSNSLTFPVFAFKWSPWDQWDHLLMHLTHTVRAAYCNRLCCHVVGCLVVGWWSKYHWSPVGNTKPEIQRYIFHDPRVTHNVGSGPPLLKFPHIAMTFARYQHCDSVGYCKQTATVTSW